jgi:hypothetical protein
MSKIAEVIRKLERKVASTSGAEAKLLRDKAAELRARNDIEQHEVDRPPEGLSMGVSTRSKIEAALRAALARPDLTEKDHRACIE